MKGEKKEEIDDGTGTLALQNENDGILDSGIDMKRNESGWKGASMTPWKVRLSIDITTLLNAP